MPWHDKRICPNCGKTFIPSRSQVKTCSLECGVELRHGTVEQRFWAKVDRSGGPDACWPWMASTGSSGYGNFFLTTDGNRRTISAHRFALIVSKGPIPDDAHACHDCPGGDNRLCCNPAHLFACTPQANTHDMMAKGRARFNGSPPGERNQNAKLTADDVRTIRQLRRQGIPAKAIAARFGVTTTNVNDILKRKLWKHVDP